MSLRFSSKRRGTIKGFKRGLNNTGVLALCEWSDRINRLVPTRIFPVLDHDAEYICRSFGIIERKFVGVAFSVCVVQFRPLCQVWRLGPLDLTH